MEFTVNTGINLAVLAGILFQVIHGTRRAGKSEGKREEFEKNIEKKVDVITASHASCHDSLDGRFFPKDRGEKLEGCVSETKQRVARLESRPCQ